MNLSVLLLSKTLFFYFYFLHEPSEKQNHRIIPSMDVISVPLALLLYASLNFILDREFHFSPPSIAADVFQSSL